MTSYLCLDGLSRPTPDHISHLSNFDIHLDGIVDSGHGIASGGNPNSKYGEEGTIKPQYPHFKERGLDIGSCFRGTLNVLIKPLTLDINHPTHRLEGMEWWPQRPPENFSICECCVQHEQHAILGFVYQPDPKTKVDHPDNPHQIQIISPKVPNLSEGSKVKVHLKSAQVSTQQIA